MKNLFLSKKIAAVTAALIIGTMALTGCGTAGESAATTAQASSVETSTDATTSATENGSKKSSSNKTNASETATTVTSAEGGVLDTSDLFTDRDLKQTADLSEATYYTVKDGEDITITEAGVYVLSGNAANVTIYVEADKDAKVQIVLDGVTITNDDFPVIYVKNADKVFVTTSSDSTLSVTGTFAADGDTNTDGVIFSKDDLVLNGTGTLTINSTDNGVVGKDTVKVTGGTYVITASSKAIEANDEILIADGTFTLTAGTDALHAENDDDDTLGNIYIAGGSFTIQVGDDAIHANSVLQIDGGEFNITAVEGLEATYIQINGGTIYIAASDDGINAANKSSAYSVCVEINDGDITIVMGQGDTDGIDSNGNIIINGGTVNVTGNSTFDYDGQGVINGGTVIVNGSEVTTLPNQMMGGGQMGGGMGFNNQMGGQMGQPGGSSGNGFGGNGGNSRGGNGGGPRR
ncbi:MAG: carbohydrate-binding domain-containing protein [Lachnospiraceae bacterium]|nr:carbohydrate-binding domain-containing protein [Lachnospiraceae bacterium]